ncbi:MAG TPA: zinc-binding dehydrogenase [Solirubrobacteraceae bacterium]|nr:zinc-binding dehydrogenase [Solirubrobacteraceae bacterium]
MRSIRIRSWGGPEVLELDETAPVPEPGEEQVLVRVTVAGVNFADTHARDNTYLARYELPLVPGAEVAGVVERDGAGFTAGQRVVALVGSGGYAEYAVAPAATTFPVPGDVPDGVALALLLQGLTAWHLFRTSARLAPGESVVVHAAGGGVGHLAVQLGRAFGAGRVIGTASTEEKRQLALELGADAAVDVGREDLAAALVEANLGERVDVVLEMAGGRVFAEGAKALAPFGRLVVYGMASGEPNEVSAGALMRRSHAVVGFWLVHCLTRPAELVDAPLQELFTRAAAGELRVIEGRTYALSEARRAHEDLQARRTTGKLLLDPTR